MAAVEEQQQSVLWGWWQSVLQSIAVDNECQCTRLHQLLPSGRRLWKDQAEFASVQLNNNKKKIMKVLYSTKIKQMAACQPGTNIYWRKATPLGVCVYVCVQQCNVRMSYLDSGPPLSLAACSVIDYYSCMSLATVGHRKGSVSSPAVEKLMLHIYEW